MNPTCPQCGLSLPIGADAAACPRCLLGLAIDSPTAAYSGEPFHPPTPKELSLAFPNLEIQQLVGAGGMGAVYRARHRVLDRVVALKILPPHLADRPDFSARFEREARALARLSHPNIVAIFDSGKAEGYYFLVMEFVDGVNLRQAIAAKAIEPDQALAIVQQICEALQFAHDQGVVHRDIKPENILLDSAGRVRVADFGLARMLDIDRASDTLTATRQVMGTPRYMAPEQLEGAHLVDHRADIYSLGVVFYELLTGELPLGRFPAPSEGHRVDRRLDQIVFRTLEKRPDARYQQASQLRTDVETVSRGGRIPRAAARPVANHWAFREYRSRTRLFGLPFVHRVSGIDPQTGRPAVARGIIAIGPTAIGGVALGGRAIGIVALGGLAMGVFSLGGCSIGLLAAIGGCSVGHGPELGRSGGWHVGDRRCQPRIRRDGWRSGSGPYWAAPYGQTPPPPDFFLVGLPAVASMAFIAFWPLLIVGYIVARVMTWANPIPDPSWSNGPTSGSTPASSVPGKPPRIPEPSSRRSRGTTPAVFAGGVVIGCLGVIASLVFAVVLIGYFVTATLRPSRDLSGLH
ncbi:MAG: protein kinase [Pirellulaceae bacterium]